MFVILPGTWLNHSFVRGKFVIDSQKQIQRILKYGISEVKVDYDKSNVVVEPSDVIKSKVVDEVVKQEALIPPNFKEIIHDQSVPPEKKADFIYQSSLGIMRDLFAHPTTESIGEFKDGVSDMVDLIVTDDETSRNLLSLTSHDFDTYTHSVNVGVHSILLTKALYGGTLSHNIHELGAAFFLHDLGKVNVDLSLITKPGRLTNSEMDVMREHPTHGYDILDETNQLSEECKVIVMQHHEREDGTGYPLGLKGDEIHPYGRICSIADVFDALTSKRPYKEGMNLFQALQIMKTEMRSHFQEDIFGEFVNLFSANS